MSTAPSPAEIRAAKIAGSLLAPNDLDDAVLEKALGSLGGPGADFGELYFETTSHEEWRLEEGKVSRGTFSISQGVGARTVCGERTGFAYSSAMTPMALTAVTDAARSMQRFGQDAHHSGGADLRTQAPANDLYAPSSAAGDLTAPQKIHILQRLDERARAVDPRVVRVSASLTLTDSDIMVCATDGTHAADVRPFARIVMTVLAQSGDKRASGRAARGGRMALEEIDEAALDRMVHRATGMALANLDARPAPAGMMPVVLGPGFPGILLHEAIGHGLEGDAHRKRSSVFVNHMGEQIAAPGVTVVDDGTVPRHSGSLNIDDEGTPGQRNVLIENGRLVGLMQDRMNARLMNGSMTGNARRQSYAHLPLPRMTNTFLQGGDLHPEEIIATVRKGIYATEFGGGTVDITTGQFNFAAVQAYLIEDGKLTAPVEGATLIGVGHEALKKVSMLGNDLSLDDGEAVCGKDGQSVLVGVGQPTVRIDEMVVGGVS
ncbi:metalloprotease TldD [Novosphingobium sp.]|uniref:metalloprotease TldD n=1 Tax=Novosphingobium sp. TaxID=1874826 RepID=UPI0028A6EE08|nr:metalloprotease TldD [Novosphingobium sp.]